MAMSYKEDASRRKDTAEDDKEALTCSVCLEIFENPMRVECNHVFCKVCLLALQKAKKPICAVCRSPLKGGTKAIEIERKLEVTATICSGCGTQVYMKMLRSHNATCPKYREFISEGVKASMKDQHPSLSNVPNRFTFTCPFCNAKNLDQDSLIEHCSTNHTGEYGRMVCPICSSMPWGDPNFKSANLIQHLKIRHKFSYDTFVDYSVDEDEMVQEAIELSLQDRKMNL
ncbi:E3 ubiquitin-protein ligase RNF114 [Hemiscyllium ocellatum]|uniref:E3 ubiquitin-protein ligase RNF114 n=1 Tax=Hemiscyllium ocellatum TaxID=170820 RepID=UPI002966DC78|nr:E3 ubiquitin-protein ligase RNF114 [Hemiscyllium ocellatum]XP_060691992.1 E3 ubiquitin-protein ligase RNF114 [Hemiscyllium ocellatum]XP_060691993.1 E3 ubiquitin-protein ligase RNF114 [Hemiscyllium ocellatum]